MRASTRKALLAVAIGLAGSVAGLVACGPSDFDPASLIESVRILASRSDKPYAHPGQTVHSEVLAVDARPDAGAEGGAREPMRVFWLPFVCVNPPNDAFYACFAAFQPNPSGVLQKGVSPDGGGVATITGSISAWDGGADASVAGGSGGGLHFGDGGLSISSIPTGTDLSPYLVQGTRATFSVPSDIVTSHPKKKGAAFPYGLAVVFNIACAGHVELVPLDPSNPSPEQIPLGCFNAQHQALTANDYVIGYTEVYAFDSLTNANPVIASFSFRDAGEPLDALAEAGVTFNHCPSGAKTCPDNIAIVGVPDASWERDPQNPYDGGSYGEQVWVDYFTTIGSVGESAILIFDPMNGRVKPPHQESVQTSMKQTGTLWAVVHDNRGGAAWITVALHAQ